MAYKIIAKFPLPQLNKFLGGIREKSGYSFMFDNRGANDSKVCSDILKKLNIKNITYDAASKNLFEFVYRMFDDSLKNKDNVLLLNGYEESLRIRECLKTAVSAVSSPWWYKNPDLWKSLSPLEYQEYLKDNNFFSEETTKKVEKIYSKKGSIIEFDNYDDRLPNRYYYASLPVYYDFYLIRIISTRNLFDKIIVTTTDELKPKQISANNTQVENTISNSSQIKHARSCNTKSEHTFPFPGLELSSPPKSITFLRDIFFEIDKFESDDYYTLKGISNLGSFKLNYNIFKNKFS